MDAINYILCKKMKSNILSSIPKQVQADHNQNDESAPDYIKNRTHYEYEGYVLTEISTHSQAIEAFLLFTNNNNLKVVINGVEYTEFTVSYFSQERRIITNDGLYTLHIGEYSKVFYFEPSDAIWYAYLPGTAVKQIDEKYIPESIARASDIIKPDNITVTDNIQYDDTVLIIQDGDVKQVDKNLLGEASSTGIVYFVTSGNYIRNGTSWNLGSEATVDDVINAYEKGDVRIFRMYSGSLVSVSNIIGYRLYNKSKRPYYYDNYSCSYIELY